MGHIRWLICIIASIAFAFDIFELLMLPLINKPLTASLSVPLVQKLIAGGMTAVDANQFWAPGGEMYVSWARTLFFVPALAGGVFGLLGGYLTDRLGRRRVLTFSILLYAFAAFSAGAFAQTLEQLLFFRCLVFIGVGDIWMSAVKGFFQLALFAGFAIYLPELFPTRLRSTGTTFCYNVGRFLAASGPLTMGLLQEGPRKGCHHTPRREARRLQGNMPVDEPHLPPWSGRPHFPQRDQRKTAPGSY